MLVSMKRQAWQCRKNWTLVRELSKFIDWQKVKVQEKSDEVPCFSLLTKFISNKCSVSIVLN